MKGILVAIFSGLLVVSLCACSGKPVRPNQGSNFSQTRGQNQNQLRYENSTFKNPVNNAYQTRTFRKTGPIFGLNLRKLFGSFRFNINETISDNFAALIVVFAVLLVIGFIVFQNRRSVRKGSYR